MEEVLKFPSNYKIGGSFCAVCCQVRSVIGVIGVDVLEWGISRLFYAPGLVLLLDCNHICKSYVWNERNEIQKYTSCDEALIAGYRIMCEILEFNKGQGVPAGDNAQ